MYLYSLGGTLVMQAYYQHRGSTIFSWMWRQRIHAFRVPGVYLGWVNSVFLSFFAFNGISNLRAFNVAFGSIPTAPTNIFFSNSELQKSLRDFAATRLLTVVQWRLSALIGTRIQMDKVQQAVLPKMRHQCHRGEMMGLKTESNAVVDIRS
jgi:hypothetical protein